MTNKTWQRQKKWWWRHVGKLGRHCHFSHLEQYGSRIPDAWSVKFTFSSTVTFYLTKTENRTKKSLTQLSYHMLTFCTKNTDMLSLVSIQKSPYECMEMFWYWLKYFWNTAIINLRVGWRYRFHLGKLNGMVEYWYDDKEVKTITDDRKLRSYTRSKKKRFSGWRILGN